MDENQRTKTELELAQQFEVIEYKGSTARKYPNGTIRNEKGQILYLPRNVALATQQSQKDLARLAAIEGMNEATKKETYYESIRELMRVRTETALNDKSRAGTEALRLVLQHTGLGQDKVSVSSVQGAIEHRLIPELPEKYLKFLEGEIVEADDE